MSSRDTERLARDIAKIKRYISGQSKTNQASRSVVFTDHGVTTVADLLAGAADTQAVSAENAEDLSRLDESDTAMSDMLAGSTAGIDDVIALEDGYGDLHDSEADRFDEGTAADEAAHEAHMRAIEAALSASEAEEKANELARVPAQVLGVRLVSNTGVWGVGAQADLVVAWDPVTSDVLGEPIEVGSYEVFDGITPLAIVPEATAGFRVAAGSGHSFTVRAGSTAGIWGDISSPVGVVGSAPDLTDRAPTAPVLTTGFGIVVARWDGSYATGGTAGAHTVTLERASGDGWVTEGVALQGVGSVTIRGTVGEALTVRLVARDMAGRVSGTSESASIVVAAVKGGDIDPDDIWANEAWVNALSAGIIRADWLEPNIGDSLNISANESVLIMVGRQAEQDAATALAQERADEALAQAEGISEKVGEAQGVANDAAAAAAGAELVAQHAQERLDEIAAVTRFSLEGIELGTADWSQELRLRPDYAAIVQNGTELSRWEAGRMIVNEMVVNQARLANHLVVKHGASRTIFRPIT